MVVLPKAALEFLKDNASATPVKELQESIRTADTALLSKHKRCVCMGNVWAIPNVLKDMLFSGFVNGVHRVALETCLNMQPLMFLLLHVPKHPSL
jgi:hypothetical protein